MCAAGPVLLVKRIPGERLALHLAELAAHRTEEQPIAVRHEQVGMAVTVEVAGGEPEPEDVFRQSGGDGGVLELQIAEVAEQARAWVFGEAVLDHKQVEQPVSVEVDDADIASSEQALRTGTAPGADIDEQMAARTGSLVIAEQGAAPRLSGALGFGFARDLPLGIVGNVEVEVPVIVEVGEHRTAGAREVADRRIFDLNEQSTFPLQEQHARQRLFRGSVFSIGPVGEAADEQIDQAIAIDVAPGAAMSHQAGERHTQADLVSDIAEGDLGMARASDAEDRGRESEEHS